MAHSTPATWKRRLLQAAAGTTAVGALALLATVASMPVPVPDSFDPSAAMASITTAADSAPAPATPELHAQGETPSLQEYCSSDKGADKDSTSYLPALRWQDFGLGYINSGFFNTGFSWASFASNIASLFFYLAALMWSVLVSFLEFGLNFKPMCYTAGSVNSMTAIIGRYTAFFFVPVIAYVLWAGRKHFFKDTWHKSVVSLGAIILAFGATFYVTDRAATAEQNAGSDPNAIIQTTGTMPWILTSITQTFSGINSAITGSLGDLSEVAVEATGRNAAAAPAFYDADGHKGANTLTCAAFDKGLVKLYEEQVKESGIANPAGMTTMNELWERAFLSNWITAQMGPGAPGENEYPAMVACRVLEGRTDGLPYKKAEDFINAYKAAGVTPQTDDATLIVESGQVYLMHPGLTSEAAQHAAWAWAYCGDYSNGKWNPTPSAADMKRSKDISCNNSDEKKGGTILGEKLEKASNDDGPLGAANEMVNSSGDNVHKFSDGEDHIRKNIGQSPETEYLREWSHAYIGGNWGQRLTAGLVALITAVLYAWSFGPAALGLVIAGVGMIMLAVLTPLSLVMWGMGKEAGKRMLALTGGTAVATFLFVIVLSLLSAIVSVLTNFVLAMFPDAGASFFRQMMLAALPVVALFLVRWGMKKLSLPDITSLAGSLGMVTGMAAKAAGDQKLTGTTTSLGDRFSRKGMQEAKKARQRDPHAVQNGMASRLKNNALARHLSNSKLGTAAKHLGSAAKDTVGLKKDQALDKFNRIPGVSQVKDAGRALAKTKSGKFAAGAFGVAAVGGAAPAALLGLGAMGLAAAGSELGIGKALDGKLNPANLSSSAARRRAAYVAKSMSSEEMSGLSPGYERDQVAGAVTSKDAKAAEKTATQMRHHFDRIQDPQERSEAMAHYVDNGMGMIRARQNGANSPDGLNATFSGFESYLAMADAQSIVASQLGVPDASVIVSSHGLVAPAAATLLDNGAPKLPPTATLEAAGHPIHYLDEATIQHQPGEDDDAYLARIHASLMARGLVGTDGKVVDVFATRGIDVSTSEGAARVEAWLAGGEDEELSSIKFTPAKGEHNLVSKALAWSDRESTDMQARQWEQAEQAAALQDEMLQTLRDPGNAPVRLDFDPSGAPITATMGDVHTNFSTQLDKMLSELERGPDPLTAAKSLANLAEVESLADNIIDGLEAGGMARAAVQVQEFSLSRRGEVDGRELKNLSNDAIRAVNYDSGRRRDSMEKSFAELAHLASKMRNGATEDTRKEAQAKAAEVVKKLNDDVAATRMAEMEANREALREFEEARQRELDARKAEEEAGYVRFSPRHRPTSSKELLKVHVGDRRFPG